MNTLLAHAGEVHETTREAAQHASDSGVTIATGQIFWIVLLVVPLVLLLIMRLLHVKLPLQLFIISSFLMIFSVVSYQEPGLYSALALGLGFSLVFLQTILGLSVTQQ